MNRKTLILMTLFTIIAICSGCITPQTILQNQSLVGKWSDGDFTVELFGNGKGYINYHAVSIDFSYRVISNNTIEISNTLLGAHQFQYQIEDSSSILITYEGSTYRLQKTT
jgi:hypothetical protein